MNNNTRPTEKTCLEADALIRTGLSFEDYKAIQCSNTEEELRSTIIRIQSQAK